MNRIHDYSGMTAPHVDNVHAHWNLGVGRAGKALICVSLFSIIVFVSGACVFAALLRAFPN
jgi:hypothetical protein